MSSATQEGDKPLGFLAGPAYEVLAPEFGPCTVPGGVVERLWTGGRWIEGPVWFDDGYLLWSDIPNDRIMRWTEADGMVTTFRQPSCGANGNTRDRQGRLLTCEHRTRRVTRTGLDGSITVLTDRFQGKRFNSPNDIVVKSDGSIWFTDPSYGTASSDSVVRELDGCHVYRLDPASGALAQVTDDMFMPNGLAFSPDESLLYIIDTGDTHFPDGPNHIRRFAVSGNGTLTGGEVFAESNGGNFDGMRVDSDGRLWCGTGDGAWCYDADGTLIGKVPLPERAANLTFGGRDGGSLFMTGTTSLYRVPVNARSC